jgi:plasmid segregation protein ParM
MIVMSLQTQVNQPLNNSQKLTDFEYFRVAIDIGYGLVKGVNERGERVLFRSTVAPAYERKMDDVFGIEDEKDEIHVVICKPDGQSSEIFVGDLALKSTRATYAFDRNKINHPTTKILLATAYSMLTKGVTKPVHLITGLPLDYYFEQKDEFEASLKNLVVEVEHKAGQHKGLVSKVKSDKVTVFIQGGASIYPCLMDINGIPTRKELIGSGELLAVANLGFHTLDVVVFEAGKKFKPLSDLSFSIDTGVGMVELRKMAEEAFFKKTNARLPLPQIEKILKKGGKQTYRGREINISAEIRQAKEFLSRVNKDHITSKLGSQLDFIHTFFWCGGGAVDLEEYLRDFHYRTEIAADAQFADALGYLIYGKIVELLEREQLKKQ